MTEKQENKKMTMTEAIFAGTSPWNNAYQGNDKKVLFVCSAGILRSATGQRLYGHKYNTRCAGSTKYALIPVTADLLLWADEVVFVKDENYEQVASKFDFDTFHCVVKVLNIPDNYQHMHPELVKQFDAQYETVDPVLFSRIVNKVQE
jgi:predicted protein tyrosine phosphatase